MLPMSENEVQPEECRSFIEEFKKMFGYDLVEELMKRECKEIELEMGSDNERFFFLIVRF